jgi:hypothetical protein
MAASITLTKYGWDIEALDASQTGYPLRIVAVGTEMPSEIFVYQDDPHTNEEFFSNIAALYEMVDLPTAAEYELLVEPAVPYFRDSEVTLYFPSIQEAETVLEQVQQDIKRLVDDYNRLPFLAEQETITIV